MSPSPLPIPSPHRLLRPVTAVVAMALTLLVAGCGGETGPTQGAVARSLADEVVVPAFAAAADATQALDDSAGAYCADPAGGDLAAVQASWLAARTAWRRTEAMAFGPRAMNRVTGQIDHTGTDAAAIEDIVASGSIPDAEAVGSTLSARSRGLGAVEHLLYGGGDLADPDRCSLLTAYTASIAAAAASVATGWTDADGATPAYRDVFVGETETMEERDAIRESVEGIVFALRAMSTFGVGRAMGVTSPEPDPEAVAEGPAGAAGADYAARIDGIAAMYRGAGQGSGLKDLVGARSTEVDAAIEAHLDALPDLIAAVGSPMNTGLAGGGPEATALLEELDGLRVSFETDVVSLLDVVIGFSDTDGDTG